MSAANKGVLSTARTEEGPKILTPQNKKTDNCASLDCQILSDDKIKRLINFVI